MRDLLAISECCSDLLNDQSQSDVVLVKILLSHLAELPDPNLAVIQSTQECQFLSIAIHEVKWKQRPYRLVQLVNHNGLWRLPD